MTSPNHPALQQLHRLDRSPPGFHDQLSDILYGEEYLRCVYGENHQQRVLDPQGDDLTWLVEFLDKARTASLFPPRTYNFRRLSMTSIPPVLLPESVYVSSKPYAAQGEYSQRHTRFLLPVSTLVLSRSPQAALVTCTSGRSMVRGFASSACGYILVMVYRRPPKCAPTPLPPLFVITNKVRRPSAKKP